ncbi:MAG: hypothetical protein MZU97_22880 [Bacillus subtilis]|nr:hypothetical protein [Bacillus subtilis]
MKLGLHWSRLSNGDEDLSIQYDLFEVAGWDRVFEPNIEDNESTFNALYLGETELIRPQHLYWLLVETNPVQLTLGISLSEEDLSDAYLDGSEIGLAILDSRFTMANVDLERNLFESTILSADAYTHLIQVSNGDRVFPGFVKRSLFWN